MTCKIKGTTWLACLDPHSILCQFNFLPALIEGVLTCFQIAAYWRRSFHCSCDYCWPWSWLKRRSISSIGSTIGCSSQWLWHVFWVSTSGGFPSPTVTNSLLLWSGTQHLESPSTNGSRFGYPLWIPTSDWVISSDFSLISTRSLKGVDYIVLSPLCVS